MIERFFVPFPTGVCLDPEIRVTDLFLRFVLKMFAEGDVAVPAHGMGEIPRQLAQGIDAAAIRYESRVESLTGTSVTLVSGEQLRGRAVVIATAEPAAALLLGRDRSMASCREACLYFTTDRQPVSEPFLTLNGSGQGLVNSVNFPSMVAPDCAPAGQYLISAVVPAYPAWQEAELEQAVRRELQQWFGPSVTSWRYLRRYLIDHALTRPQPPAANPYRLDPHLGGGLFDCSESRTLPSIQWALLTGQRTAGAVRSFLAREK
jgi:phytoene dehydrogenase-like protein